MVNSKEFPIGHCCKAHASVSWFVNRALFYFIANLFAARGAKISKAIRVQKP